LKKKRGKAVDTVTSLPKVWRSVLFRDHIMLAFNGKYLEPAVKAAVETKFRLPIGQIASINDAIPLIISLEQGKGPKGKGVLRFQASPAVSSVT
jgi:hypothetical protein